MSPVAVIDLALNTAAWILIFRLDITADVVNRTGSFFVNNLVNCTSTINEKFIVWLHSLSINIHQISMLESVIDEIFEVEAESFIVVDNGPGCTGGNTVPIFAVCEEEDFH